MTVGTTKKKRARPAKNTQVARLQKELAKARKQVRSAVKAALKKAKKQLTTKIKAERATAKKKIAEARKSASKAASSKRKSTKKSSSSAKRGSASRSKKTASSRKSPLRRTAGSRKAGLRRNVFEQKFAQQETQYLGLENLRCENLGRTLSRRRKTVGKSSLSNMGIHHGKTASKFYSRKSGKSSARRVTARRGSVLKKK